MSSPRLSRHQHNAVIAAAGGPLQRKADGWHGTGDRGSIHSFQTVSSLENRRLLVTDARRKSAALSNDGRLYVARRQP